MAVAAIGLVATVAVVNQQEAQVRAKLSRAMADMTAIGNALEFYRLDQGSYPETAVGYYPGSGYYCWWMMVYTGSKHYAGSLLTTPVAYLPRIPTDPFVNRSTRHFEWGLPAQGHSFWGNIVTPGVHSRPFESWIQEMSVLGSNFPERFDWLLQSPGPDGRSWDTRGRNPFRYIYDPTNGTASEGEIALCNVGWVSPRGK